MTRILKKRSQVTQYVRVGVGITLGLVALGWSLRQVNLGELWDILKSVLPVYLLGGLVSVGMNLAAKILRWGVLLGKDGNPVRVETLTGIVLSGQVLNAIFPGRLGDVARIFLMGRYRPKAFIVGTLALEKWLDTLAFVVLFWFALVWLPLPSWIEGSVVSLFALAIFGSISLVCLVYYVEPLQHRLKKGINRLPDKFRKWLLIHLESGFASLHTLKALSNWMSVIFWTLMIWGTAILNNYLGLRALDIHLPLSVSVVLLIGLQVGIVVANSPGALGVFEYICVLTLTFFGLAQSQALGAALLLHGLVYLPMILAGLWPLVKWGIPLPINSSEG